MRVEIKDVPREYISGIEIISEQNQIIIVSYDGTLSVYTVDRELKQVNLTVRLQYESSLTSVAQLNIQGRQFIYAGSVDGQLLSVDLENSLFVKVDQIESSAGISCIAMHGDRVIAGSWDGSIYVVNPYSNSLEFTLELPSEYKKCFKLSVQAHRLLISTIKCKIAILKLPLTPTTKPHILDSGQIFQIRDSQLTPEGDGFVCTGIDGRVSVEYFDDTSKRFAFRCHKYDLDDTVMTYPINAIRFIPNTSEFYTGGSDGCVSAWHLHKKTKIKQLPKYNENSVVQLACNENILCVATSDDSFKTNAVIDSNLELEPSRIYVEILTN